MQSLESSVLGLQALDRESVDLIVGLGLICVSRSRKSEDWYVYASLEGESAIDKERVRGLLAQCGTPSNHSWEQVFNHQNRFFCGSGSLTQIMGALSALSVTDAKLGPEIRRIRSMIFGEAGGIQV